MASDSRAKRDRARNDGPYRMKMSGIGKSAKERKPKSETVRIITLRTNALIEFNMEERTSPVGAKVADDRIRDDRKDGCNDGTRKSI